MEGVENNKATPAKKPRRKALKIIVWAVVVIILVLIIVIAVAVPAYVSSDSCRQMILAKAKAADVGSVDFANLKMGWSKGISISRLSYKDKAEAVSVAVKEFSTKPRYGALLTGNLSLGETVIDEPRIELNVDKMKGKPEGAGTKTEAKGQKKETKAQAGLPIGRIDLLVKNGDVKITGGKGGVEISQINSSVNLRPEGDKTDFEIGAKVAGGNTASTISAKGNVKPGKGWNPEKTSGDVTIEVNNLNLASLESILAIAGVDVNAKGVVSGNIKGAIKDGMIDNVSCEIKGKGLEITSSALKGDKIKTNVLDAEVAATRAGDLMNVEKLTVETDWLKADANGATPLSIATLEDFLKPDSKNELRANLECDIPAVTAQLPTTLGLKEGMKLTGGRLTGGVETQTEGGMKKLSARISVEGLAGVVNGKPAAIAEPIKAQALITMQGKEIKFEKAGLTSAFANVNCTGTVESFNYDAQADLAKLAGEIGQFADVARYKLAGQVTSKGQISNNDNTTIILNSSNIEGLKVSPTTDITIAEPNASIDITAAIDKKKQVFLVKQFNAGTSLGQFSVKDGRVPMGKDSKEPMELTASAKGVDLARVQPYLVMSKAISKDVQLGGIAETNVTVGCREGVYKFTTEDAKISNLLVKSPGKTSFMESTVTVILDAEVNPESMAWVIKADITSPDIKIKGNFQQKAEGQTSNMQGNAQLDYDWKAVSGMLSAFLPSGLVMEGKRKDTISFSSKYPARDTNAMLANLDAQAKVGFEKAAYKGLNFGVTNVDIKVEKGFLTISPFTTTANNGQINFGGSADFKKTPAIFRTPAAMDVVKDVQINDVVANTLLAKVNPIFANASKVSGVANLKCDKLAVPITGGKPEDYDIAGTVSLTQMKMQTGLLQAILAATGSTGDIMMLHPTPFTVKDGFVRYQNMQLDIGNMPINFTGAVPVDPNRKIENFSVALPVTGLGKVVRTGKEGTSGRVTAYVKGTPNKPELDLGKMVEQQALQTGLDMLMQQAGKKK